MDTKYQPAGLIQDVMAAQSGSVEAFGRIVRRFQDMAFAVSLGRLGDAAAAEEAAQDAFIEAFMNLESLHEPAAFPGWFRTIVARQCSRALRSRKPAEELFDEPAAPERNNPETVAELSELKDMMMDLLHNLPERERIVILMHYIGDYTQNEISDFLELPITTIKKRLHDGKAHLRRFMTDALQLQMREVRPSRNSLFKDTVEFAGACITGDSARAGVLLQRNPRLVATFSEVNEPHMRTINASWGWPPLHLAAHYGNLEIVKLLVEKGANLEARALNAIGNTALGAAVWGNRVDVVKCLIDAHADLNAVNHFGQTPLHRAVHRGASDIVRLLLAAGADATISDSERRTALATAELLNKPDMIGILRGTYK